jgi:4-diphosphocytidyl-2-C-methyl-D-erythritol kinase
MGPLTVRAHAKVNLSLEVLGRRADGYHDVATVLQSVSLHDEITLTPASDLSLRCNVPGLDGPDNLAWQAAELLRSDTGVRAGAAIDLRKRIPVAAGLGGGSSDAAATLLGLDALWDLDLGLDRLTVLAARLGADVPFFVRGGTALAEGFGERVTPLPTPSERWLVVVVPGDSVERKTATLYGSLRSEHFTRGEAVAAVADAARRAEPWPEGRMVNTFESVADDVFPSLAACRRVMTEAGAGRVHLSGAGPSLFVLVADEDAGRELALRLEERGLSARVVHTVGAESLGASERAGASRQAETAGPDRSVKNQGES